MYVGMYTIQYEVKCTTNLRHIRNSTNYLYSVLLKHQAIYKFRCRRRREKIIYTGAMISTCCLYIYIQGHMCVCVWVKCTSGHRYRTTPLTTD